MIRHINLKNTNGEVYCCLRNKVVSLNEEQMSRFCRGCPMFAGTAEGKGVECVWEDVRDVSNPLVVHDPVREFISNQHRKVAARDSSAFLQHHVTKKTSSKAVCL